MRARTLALAALVVVGLTGCAPQPNSKGCGNPTPALLARVERSVTKDGELRNARTYTPTGSPWTFVSIERRTKLNVDEHKSGNILTFAVRAGATGDLVAVDQQARKNSEAPDAPFDVRHRGAIESRGCVYHAYA